MENDSLRVARENAVRALVSGLRENLCACIEYGSTVRGDFVPGVSDLNLLIILNESTPEAHEAIAEAIHGPVRIEPFVIGRAGMARRCETFAVKFMSIRRHYRVLHGQDLLADLAVPPEVERFVCEQVVRNLHLRLVHAFITLVREPRRYTRYVVEALPGMFTDLSEILRLKGIEVPVDFAGRVPALGKEFDADAGVLLDLLGIKRSSRDLRANEVRDLHGRIFRLVCGAIACIERTWPRNAWTAES